ncbi:DUF2269 family protein [Gemmatimonas sp.]|uniref:DUF2269 family protein n=1 Tax=Gemmatimonas sp. TaxID=1962908 RepID=UPI0025BFB1D6|nr:DUF2269 family protein [Gemmatimonas sp.]MCA2989201.1 DUF2269 family protein [Gemmatimonas sp.]MCA2996212.1 DUF2269 family protein [Gemmatimonas sp.]MCE2952176.1 DUF2269 domain-containing protein [Gemmatimonas sp.]
MTLDAFLKTAHVLGAIVFVGNVIVTGVWTAIFWRARHTHDFRRAARAIVITDWWFTVGGGALLTVSGITLALQRGLPLWGTPWIRQAIVALTLSTVLWVVVLVPAQRRMVQHTGGANDESLVRAYGRWSVWGWTATAPLVYAVWCMVAKPG